MSHDEILDIVRKASKEGITEVHIVSAHNNQVDLDWYLEIFAKIKREFPALHIKALTAAEIIF